MNAIISNYKNTVYRLRMNKKTRTIKIDVYYLDTVTAEVKKTKEYLYVYTLNCIGVEKSDFNYYYNNYATFNDVEQLTKTADNHTIDFTPYYKFKY